MDPARWAQVRDLLARCLESDEKDLPRLLEAGCGNDPDLRREVESLLDASRQDAFLDRDLHDTGAVPEVLQSGVCVGPYQALRQIGEGGMGIVYEGRNTVDGTPVALKALNAVASADEPLRRRFLREARLISRLTHPGIVRVLEVLEEDSQQVIVMELVKGDPLGNVIPCGGLPVNRAAEIAVQISSALACAHEAGIIHRDLKPANVILMPDGVVKVLDFGAAKQLAREQGGLHSSSTATGVLLGSPAYMSPEQAMGKVADAKSDVFSFGVLLYEMLTGVKAFERSSMLATLSAVVREHPTRVRRLRPEIPRYMDRLVDICVQKSPARRPSMQTIQQHLADGTASSPFSATIHTISDKCTELFRFGR